jgi:cholera toxin transcriptional activator
VKWNKTCHSIFLTPECRHIFIAPVYVSDGFTSIATEFMNTATQNQAADSGATLSCLIIKTGRADCHAHFYPTLYQLTLLSPSREEKIDLGFSGSRLLERLLQTPGEVVSREELMSHAWADRVVGQGSLNQQVYTLRQVLSDEKNRDIIQTLPRRGYMFNPSYLMGQPPQADSDDAPAAPANPAPAQLLPSKRSLLIALPISLTLLGCALLAYYYLSNLPLQIPTQHLSAGSSEIRYINPDEQILQRLVTQTEALRTRIAGLSDKPNQLIISMSADYYEVLCAQPDKGVKSLMFHKSQLDLIADAQLLACLP